MAITRPDLRFFMNCHHKFLFCSHLTTYQINANKKSQNNIHPETEHLSLRRRCISWCGGEVFLVGRQCILCDRARWIYNNGFQRPRFSRKSVPDGIFKMPTAAKRPQYRARWTGILPSIGRDNLSSAAVHFDGTVSGELEM